MVLLWSSAALRYSRRQLPRPPSSSISTASSGSSCWYNDNNNKRIIIPLLVVARYWSRRLPSSCPSPRGWLLAVSGLNSSRSSIGSIGDGYCSSPSFSPPSPSFSSLLLLLLTRQRRRRNINNQRMLRSLSPTSAAAAASSSSLRASSSSSSSSAAAAMLLLLLAAASTGLEEEDQNKRIQIGATTLCDAATNANTSNTTPKQQQEQEEVTKGQRQPSSSGCHSSSSQPPSSSSWWRLRGLLAKISGGWWSSYASRTAIPRVVREGDADLAISPRRLKQRKQDEATIRQLRERTIRAIAEDDKKLVLDLVQQSFQVLYGDNNLPNNNNNDHDHNNNDGSGQTKKNYKYLHSTPPPPPLTVQDRQEFLERYGCTGWTDDVMNALLALGDRRGFVEIGAGNGQWARKLTDAHNERRRQAKLKEQQKQQYDGSMNHNSKAFEFVLAYDDMSALPLNPQVYHSRTQPARDYFYDKVRPIRIASSNNNNNSPGAAAATTQEQRQQQQQQQQHSMNLLLRQWQCRGRILLLVYPPPGPMAARALRAYCCCAGDDDNNNNNNNNTVIYIGEGRNGANADEDFFDLLESKTDGDNNNNYGNNNDEYCWVLIQKLPVQVFGTKGYEQMFVFQRQHRAERSVGEQTR